MKAWEDIVNQAMLGTDKPSPLNINFPEELAGVAALIDEAAAADPEQQFLEKAAVIYNYRQCGFVPLQRKELVFAAAAAESKPYCNPSASAVLNTVLREDNIALLRLWLIECERNHQLMPPDALPAVLDKAAQQPALQSLAVSCSGERGSWLSKLNSGWNYFVQPDAGETWLTGKTSERLKILQNLRKTDPEKALKLLQETWEQENAAAKCELLSALAIKPGSADLPWLEGLLTEKSAKVKDEAIALLKRIPGSSIIKMYEELLRTAVVLKKEKALLGMMNKISIVLQLPGVINEDIFKSGIEKLRGQKSGMSDNDFIIYQLTEVIPPGFWLTQFDASPEEVVVYFGKYAPALTPALALAVSRFAEKEWIPYFLEHTDHFYPDFLDFMPPREQEKYLLRFLKDNPSDIIRHALRCNNEWGKDFALAALHDMAAGPYQYNRIFFSQNIGFIPLAIIKQIEKIESGNANVAANWEKIRTHLISLLTIKQQIFQAFNIIKS